MRKFMDENFLLTTETSQKLYHNYAKDMPIFDYHCHLPAEEIANDKSYDNITQLWLYHDHYKWRAMRSFGIDEKYITGDATDEEKFYEFAKMMPYLIGNPIYHWSHLELRKYFNITKTLSEKTAKDIWEDANLHIKEDNLTAIKLIEISNVHYIGTTDDPIDNLEFHKNIKANSDINFTVAPSFRPDRVLKIQNKDFIEYIQNLEVCSKMKIENIDDLIQSLEKRLELFIENECTISDHSLEDLNFIETSKKEANEIFIKALNKEILSNEECIKYFTYVFLELGNMYAKNNIVMQLHIGALRNNNTKKFNQIGADAGFDSIDDTNIAKPLSKLLDALNNNELPKTILYCLNPKDNEVIATMCGNFQDGNIAGKMQFGSGWWFNDQKDGMNRQLMALSQLGILSKFIGMLTDSRSFTSYVRHD